jgi:hypothetical protein
LRRTLVQFFVAQQNANRRKKVSQNRKVAVNATGKMP